MLPEVDAEPTEGSLEGITERGRRLDVADVDAQVDHRLRDGRRKAGYRALTSHEPGRFRHLDEVVRDGRDDVRDAADGEDEDPRARLRDHREHRGPDVLGSPRVDEPDYREHENALPDNGHRGRHLHERLALVRDLLAGELG